MGAISLTTAVKALMGPAVGWWVGRFDVRALSAGQRSHRCHLFAAGGCPFPVALLRPDAGRRGSLGMTDEHLLAGVVSR